MDELARNINSDRRVSILGFAQLSREGFSTAEFRKRTGVTGPPDDGGMRECEGGGAVVGDGGFSKIHDK